jgi:diguanylate cyclase (GGDEF)-like protein/PAS domain S-box-containing protein
MTTLGHIRSPSLKIRIAVAVVLLLGVTAIFLTYSSIAAVQHSMEKIITENQTTLIKKTADDIDLKFSLRKTALQHFAHEVPKNMLGDAEGLQRFLEQHHSLDELFDNFSIFNLKGEQEANLDLPGSRGKFNAASRKYFTDTVALKKGVISAPLRSAISDKLIVVMTEPLFDSVNKVAAVLAATIVLDHDSFLGDLSKTRVGKTGYFYVFTADGTVVAHPEASLILKNATSANGSRHSFEKALTGYEGTYRSSSQNEISGLFSFKRLSTVDWIIGAIYPETDAFAAVNEVKENAFLVAAILILLSGPLAWWYARWQVMPLQKLRARIHSARENPGQPIPADAYSTDEMGKLALEFDSMMRERLAAEARYQASSEELRLEAEKNRAFLKLLIDYLPVGIYTKSVREEAFGRIILWNKAAELIMGLSVEQVSGKTVREFHSQRMADITEEQDRSILENPMPLYLHDQLYRRPDGMLRVVDAKSLPIFDDEGRVEFILGIVEDITARKKSENALLEEKERLRVTLNSIGDAVITTDTDGKVTYLNPVAEKITGWPCEAAVGQPLMAIFHLVNESSGRDMPNPVTPILSGIKALGLARNSVLVQRGGTRFLIDESVAPIRDARDRIIGAIVVFHDVSEAHLMAAEMSHQATHDALTGLINRSEFENRLAQALKAGALPARQHTLLYLDLDQFKIVNDTSGHVAGDELLRQLTPLLEAKLRQSDTLARLGGDEFGVLLENCSPEPALRVADLLRKTVGEFHFSWQEKVFPVGVSIGLATFSNAGETLADVLRMADAACYVAKDKGRNRIHVYTPEDKELAQRHGEMAWIGKIQKTLDEQRFVLYSQKILPLGDNDEHGEHYEILIRMLDEGGKLVPPMAFIPAAERYGLMPILDRWVIKTAFSQYAARHPAGGPPGSCSINLSGTSICDEHLLEYVIEEFDRHKVPPQAICFEVTETSAIANLTQAAALMREFKAIGCRISLDDFGSGMSSFAYLKHLPVDYLKIDGGFVKGMMEDPIDHAMVKAINQIGHVMGIRTIAEFVENDAILEELRSMGVDYAQGYGVEKPRPTISTL